MADRLNYYLIGLWLLVLNFAAWFHFAVDGSKLNLPVAGEIVGIALVPFALGAAIAVPWHMRQRRRGRGSTIPLFAGVLVAALLCFAAYAGAMAAS